MSAAAGCAPKAADTPLTTAAARNDAAEIRRLLAAGRHADAGRDVTSALIRAARSGVIEAMSALIGAGANVDRRDSRARWTVLLHAIHKRRVTAVRLLLEHGADPNAATPGGVTPLLMSADDPNPTIVTLLLAHGANPRIEGSRRQSPAAR